MRQALGGLLWSKQFYHYDVNRWLKGDPAQPEPPAERAKGRNHEWRHLYNADVISMPDKWEYPWYAAWDLAFHCVALAIVDSDFAKEQLLLMTREWYMHPNGQLPAYEWAFGDVNPPVHAWAAWRVYKVEMKRRGEGDRKVSRTDLSKAAAQFHLVGQSQRRRRAQCLSGRLSRSRQHRRLRPQRAAAHRRPHRAVRRHQLDGHVLSQHAGHRAGTGERQSRLRRRRQQVLRALCLHLRRDEQSRRREHRAVGRPRRLFLRCAHSAQRPAQSAQSALHGRADSALRRGNPRSRIDRQAARLQAPHAMVHRESPRAQRAYRNRIHRRRSAPLSVAGQPPPLETGAALHARRK